MSGLIESCTNSLEKTSILKTVRGSGVDFNKLTTKRKRGKMSLQESLFVLFKPLQVRMTSVSCSSIHACQEALQEDCSLCLAQNLKDFKIIHTLQVKELSST